ncbi:hypothetical protein [Streptomyces cyaneofuscatus]|uniref:hypothetical protein n=1 Tax=Streptomyces cyaneofuscatus TaxID=66883 RepID=UPI0037F78885
MADRTRIIPNRRGIARMLTTPGTRRLIEARTRQIEAAAVRAAEPDAGMFRTDVTEEPTRVRGAVIGDYATSDPAESRRALLRGLDGGRT